MYHVSWGNKCRFWQIFIEALEECPILIIWSQIRVNTHVSMMRWGYWRCFPTDVVALYSSNYFYLRIISRSCFKDANECLWLYFIALKPVYTYDILWVNSEDGSTIKWKILWLVLLLISHGNIWNPSRVLSAVMEEHFKCVLPYMHHVTCLLPLLIICITCYHCLGLDSCLPVNRAWIGSMAPQLMSSP